MQKETDAIFSSVDPTFRYVEVLGYPAFILWSLSEFRAAAVIGSQSLRRVKEMIHPHAIIIDEPFYDELLVNKTWRVRMKDGYDLVIEDFKLRTNSTKTMRYAISFKCVKQKDIRKANFP